MSSRNDADSRADKGAPKHDSAMPKCITHTGKNPSRLHATLCEIIHDVIASREIKELLCGEQAHDGWNQRNSIQKQIRTKCASRHAARTQANGAQKKAECARQQTTRKVPTTKSPDQS